MPKMKTKSGAKKRFKFLGNGLIKRTHSHLRHILTKKTTKQKRNLRGTTIISSTDSKRVRSMMPTRQGVKYAKSKKRRNCQSKTQKSF